MTNERTLAACPFCGRSDTVKYWRASEMHANCENDPDNDESYGVVCDASNGMGGCGASAGFAATYEEAADRWNRRSVVEPPADPTRCSETRTLRCKLPAGHRDEEHRYGLFGWRYVNRTPPHE